MRIGFLPNAPRDVYLREHADIEPRPTLVCRTLSKAEFDTLWGDLADTHARVASDIAAGREPEADAAITVRFMARVVTGWRNVKDAGGADMPFDLSKLPELCTPRQLAELFLAAIDERNSWDADSGKASRSPLSSPAGKSANGVAAGSAASN